MAQGKLRRHVDDMFVTARDDDSSSSSPTRQIVPRPAPTAQIMVPSPPGPGTEFLLLERHLITITSHIEALRSPYGREELVATFSDNDDSPVLDLSPADPHVAMLAAALESLEPPVAGAGTEHLKSAIETASSLQVGDDQVAAGLRGVLRHLEIEQAPAENDLTPDLSKEDELSNIDVDQARPDRRTQISNGLGSIEQDTIDALHDAVGHLFDELTIEDDLRELHAQRPATPSMPVEQDAIDDLDDAVGHISDGPTIEDDLRELHAAQQRPASPPVPVEQDAIDEPDEAVGHISDGPTIEDDLRELHAAQQRPASPSPPVEQNAIDEPDEAVGHISDGPTIEDDLRELHATQERPASPSLPVEQNAIDEPDDVSYISDGPMIEDDLRELHAAQQRPASPSLPVEQDAIDDPDDAVEYISDELIEDDLRELHAAQQRPASPSLPVEQNAIDAPDDAVEHISDEPTIEDDLRELHVAQQRPADPSVPAEQDTIDALYHAIGHTFNKATMDDLREIYAAQQRPAGLSSPVESTEQAPVEHDTIEQQSSPRFGLPNPFVAASDGSSSAPPRTIHRIPEGPAPAAHVASDTQLDRSQAPRTQSGRRAPPAQAATAIESQLDHPQAPRTQSGRRAPPTQAARAVESQLDHPQAPRMQSGRRDVAPSEHTAKRPVMQAAGVRPKQHTSGPGNADREDLDDAKESSTLPRRILFVLGFVITIGAGAILYNTAIKNRIHGEATASTLATVKNSSKSDSDPTIPNQVAPSAIAQPQPAGNDDASKAISEPPTEATRSMTIAPAVDRLPDEIGGPVLRSAAMKGDPSAAFEVGFRFAEGKGVPANYAEAAKWLERAVQAGVVPAAYEIGTLYEKGGPGIEKNLDTARRYYTMAAERGNAKAMYDLGVLDANLANTLDANGRDGSSNQNSHESAAQWFRSAAQWFRKAADHGIADGQFNLGILYFRGVGVEQSLVESYKWFSLAAAQGDHDAAGRRDSVARHLDPTSLAEAKLATQSFTAEPQPNDAINVTAPAGGWDATQARATPVKHEPNRAGTKRSAATR